MVLRHYQARLVDEVEAAIARGSGPVLGVLPTGGGKTVCMAELFARRGSGGQPGIAVAHRQELISQISLALARRGIPHRLVCPLPIAAFVVERHVEVLGNSWVDSSAAVAVASVDTVQRRGVELPRSALIQTDEGHHVVPGNKWTRAVADRREASFVGWTATPLRADGRSLSAERDGFYADLVQGPSASELVAGGYLAPLEAYSLSGGLDRGEIRRSDRTGDFSERSMREVTRRAVIVGDVVEHYLRIVPGEPGVTFTVDVESAEEMAAAYRSRGVPAEAISARMPDRRRQAALDALAAGFIRQICNCDIVGEGFDLPAIRAVSMVRPTESLPLCYQQVGRARRPKNGLSGVVLDHVGNLLVHGIPDRIERWTLDGGTRRDGRALGDLRGMPVRQCGGEGCWRVFESWAAACPHCGWRPEPRPASTPEEVEGDLELYGPELLAELARRARAAVAPPPPRAGRRTPASVAIDRNIVARTEAQVALRSALGYWAGVMEAYHALSGSAAYRRFAAQFGVDAATAYGLGGPEARRLEREVWRDLLGERAA